MVLLLSLLTKMDLQRVVRAGNEHGRRLTGELDDEGTFAFSFSDFHAHVVEMHV